MDTMITEFAPAERADIENISIDTAELNASVLIQHMTNAIPCIILLLNKQRQIVYKNQLVMDLLSATSDDGIIGKRPGELLDCVHANKTQGGCGTTESCRECGAVIAILKSQSQHRRAVEECRITTNSGDAFEFKVWATPYVYSDKKYTILSLLNITHEKRRKALERTFFHDINNILTGLVGFSELIDTSTVPQNIADSIEIIKASSNELVDEIANQRRLLEAEDGKLALQLTHDINSFALVDKIVRISSKIWIDRSIISKEELCEDFAFTSDRSILFRILYNMVKNAIEASSVDQVVSIGCSRGESFGVFSVHNPNFIPRSVQLQIFQRSFSTKGQGRGIGTYSMKLFGEKYLKGKVWFSSSEDKGTTFFISIPLSYKNK